MMMAMVPVAAATYLVTYDTTTTMYVTGAYLGVTMAMSMLR